MKWNSLHLRRAVFCFASTFCLGTLFGQASSLGIIMQDAYFSTQFNSGGDFFNQGSTELAMWANQNANQTVAWRDFKTTGDNSGATARSLQIGDEFSITVSCTRAFGQIGFSLNASGTQGASYSNNINGTKLFINTDNYGSWYISNGSTASSFNYNPSQDVFKDYKFTVKILSPTLITASLYVNGGFHSAVQNFSLVNSNPITSFSIYGSDMWDGNSNDNAYWKSCSVTSTSSVELGYALSSGGNITPGAITDGLLATSNSLSSPNAVLIGGNSGSSVIYNSNCTYTGLTTINTNATLRISSDQTLSNLTINSGGTVIIDPNVKLTLSGKIDNNGTLTINNGATLVQTGTVTNTGTGTYNVKQTIIGSGSGTPTGRYWYVGSPVSGATSAVYDAAGANILKYYSEAANAWQEITDNTSSLEVGRGYFVQAASGTSELNFTGGTINNGDYTLNVTRNTSTNAYRGYNLLTNPYPSYLDWDNVTRSNVGETIWYRSVNNAGTMVFDTYNAPAGTGTNNNQAGAVTRYIPPMQSFWVSVPQGQTSGTVSFGNAQRSHYSTGVQGLRSSAQDFPAFLRLNLLDGNFVDQTILYMKPDANNTFDEFDSEKMFLGGVPQFYSTVNAKKLVLNGMKNQKARTSVPLTMELPTSKSYTFQAEEFNIEDGLILLEDKQEGVIQDLTINPTYSFFGNAGTNATRFVVHFQLANAPVLVGGPQELENLGMDQLSTDNIQITSNNQGTVIVRLDEGFKPEGSIRIFDASGRLVEQRDFNDQETTIQLNEQAGLYFVEVAAGKLMVKKKIVIE
jgi:hypothetical protein